MRLKARASVNSVEPQLGQTPSILSSRHRWWQCRQSTRGSVKLERWPDASHTAGGDRMAASRPTTSVPALHHGLPPGVLHVAQQVDPEGPVVVGGAEAAVDLRRLEDEAPPLAQADHLLHQVGPVARRVRDVLGFGHRGNGTGWHRTARSDQGTCSAPARSRAVTALASSRPRTVSTARPVARSTRPSRSGSSGRASAGTPAGVRSAEGERLEPALVVGEHLLAGRGVVAGLDQGHVAVGGPDVPPPPAGPVRVGGRSDAPVVALVPVEAVVTALVAGSGPVGDLLPPVAGRRRGSGRPSRTGPPGRRRRGGGPGRRPAGCPARRSGSRR